MYISRNIVSWKNHVFENYLFILWKENLNNDGQPIITKYNRHISHQTVEHKMATSIDVGNPGPGLRQVENVAGVLLRIFMTVLIWFWYNMS